MYFSVILLYIVVFWRATSLLALGYYVLPSFINKGFIIIIIIIIPCFDRCQLTATWMSKGRFKPRVHVLCQPTRKAREN